jgi:protein-arginine kinase activator protein McsA
MSDYKQRLDNIMLQLQTIIDEEYEDNANIQDAFNALACALDEEYYQ